MFGGGLTVAQSEIQQPHDTGINRCRMFDLECGGDLKGCGIQPDCIDQRD